MNTKTVDQEDRWTAKDVAALIGVIVLTFFVVLIACLAITGGDIGKVGQFVGAVLGFIVFTVAYLLPTIIAAKRELPHSGSITVINVLLGFTYVGWVVALAMAVRSKP